MPKRKDIKKILIIGAGPIVIGQACEFDYSGAQACKALKEENFKVILVNSNPATIMTDPNLADRTYIEPLEIKIISKIIPAYGSRFFICFRGAEWRFWICSLPAARCCSLSAASAAIFCFRAAFSSAIVGIPAIARPAGGIAEVGCKVSYEAAAENLPIEFARDPYYRLVWCATASGSTW